MTLFFSLIDQEGQNEKAGSDPRAFRVERFKG